MKKQLISALFSTLSIALFAATSGAAVAAQGHDGGHDGKHRSHRGAGMHDAGDPGRMVRHLTRRLELDETQQQKIDNIVSAAEPEMDALQQRADANRLGLQELRTNDSSYDAKLHELAAEKGAIATERALLHGRLKSDINAVLTPEQRSELSDDAERMRDHYQKRKEERSQVD